MSLPSLASSKPDSSSIPLSPFSKCGCRSKFPAHETHPKVNKLFYNKSLKVTTEQSSIKAIRKPVSTTETTDVININVLAEEEFGQACASDKRIVSIERELRPSTHIKDTVFYGI